MRKRSSTNGQRESSITFFADRDLGKEFVEILRSGGLEVESFWDHFPEYDRQKEKDDRKWIRLCAQNEWVAFSKNKGIAWDYPEIKEVMTSGAEMFVPEGQKHPTEFAELILRSLPRIYRHIKQKRKWDPEPFISKIGFDPKDKAKAGKVQSWVTRANWEEKTKKRRGE